MAYYNAFFLSVVILGLLGARPQDLVWQSRPFLECCRHDGREKTSWGSRSGDEVTRPRPHAPSLKGTREFKATMARMFWWSELMSPLEVGEGCNWQDIPQYWRMTAVCEGRDKGKMRSQDARWGQFSLGADGQPHWPEVVAALYCSIKRDAQISSQSAKKSEIVFCAICLRGLEHLYYSVEFVLCKNPPNIDVLYGTGHYAQLILPRPLIVATRWDCRWFCYCRGHCTHAGSYFSVS